MGTQHILCRNCHLQAILEEKEVVDCLFTKRPVLLCANCSSTGKIVFGEVETLEKKEISIPVDFVTNGNVDAAD